MANDVIFLPIRQLAELVRARRVSPVELAQTFLDRLESIEPQLNAVVTVTRERAMRQARQAEQEIASGHYKSLLHGTPYGAKDLLATSQGIPTTWGAAPLRDQVFDYDATVVRKLEAAGAVLCAKLAMIELAGGMGYGGRPNASFTGPARNPWDRKTWTGGSSSGWGAAVAAGLTPFAIGSETWGSILGPANNCGVAGLRPTYGRVSRYGAMALSWTLDKLGPLCLTADDCGLVLEAIAGPDHNDPSATDRPYRYHGDAIPSSRFKLGVIKGVTTGVQKAVKENFSQALKALEEVASIEEVELPDLPYDAAVRTILQAEAASAFDEFVDSGRAAELTAPGDWYGGYARTTVLAKDYLRALRIRGLMVKAVDQVLIGFDALVAPSSRSLAPRIDRKPHSPTHEPQDVMGAIGNGAGLPAISVPCGFSDRGLPSGIQFMGRAYEENTILTVARAYQSLTDWHKRHPEED